MLLGIVFCEVFYLPHTAVTGIVKKGCIFSTGGGYNGNEKKEQKHKKGLGKLWLFPYFYADGNSAEDGDGDGRKIRRKQSFGIMSGEK